MVALQDEGVVDMTRMMRVANLESIGKRVLRVAAEYRLWAEGSMVGS